MYTMIDRLIKHLIHTIPNLLIIVGFLSLFFLTLYNKKEVAVDFTLINPGTFQVYYLTDNLYSEEKSDKGNFEPGDHTFQSTIGSSTDGLIRFDPTNVMGSMFIKKITINGFLSTVSLLPVDIISRISRTNMISRLEIHNDGLLIESTGNDPGFIIQLNGLFVLADLYRYIALIVTIASIISGFILLICRKFNTGAIDSLILFWIAVLFSLTIATVFYPGFMSYDSIYAMTQARDGVVSSEWPPMVGYVWRLIDVISNNPSLMQFTQVFLLLISLLYINKIFLKKNIFSLFFLVFYLSVPVVLGTISVIWKDVLMSAFFLSALVIFFLLERTSSKKTFFIITLFGILFLIVGICARHNAIFGAIPIFLYFAYTLSKILTSENLKRFLFTIVIAIAIVIPSSILKITLDNYSLPNFNKIENKTSDFINTVRIQDIAAASLCADQSLYGYAAPDISLESIRKYYAPWHVLASKNLHDIVPNKFLVSDVWYKMVINHPLCSLANKYNIVKYLLGINNGDQYLLFHPTIDANKYGYYLPESSFRNSIVSYIANYSTVSFMRPWSIYLITIICFPFLYLYSRHQDLLLVLFSSALFYFFGLIFFGNAADARLPFYTTSIFSLINFISIVSCFEFIIKKFFPHGLSGFKFHLKTKD